MDKIIELSDFFGIGNDHIDPIILVISVLVVVIGAVAAFIFGFKEAKPPKFRRRTSNYATKIKKQQLKHGKSGSTSSKTEVSDAPLNQKLAKKEVTSKVALVKPAPTTTIASQTSKALKTDTKKKVAGKNVKNGKEVLSEEHTDKTMSNPDADNGAWKTVTSKRQRQVSISSLNQSSAGESMAKAVDSKDTAKNPKNKQSKKKAKNAKKGNGEQKLEDPVNDKLAKVSVEQKAAPPPVAVQVEEPEALVEFPKKRANIGESGNTHSEVVYAVNGQETISTSNESEDAGWIEAAANKKSKKRALRE